ncbi:diguanylate cyclase [Lampropedia puyangensis]|uniref:Diguanylate cyclase n=1 Tax=Lampropedia puyangensis TaxID=1330072 RepID=A0A4V4GRS2_9BURK|nr:diguanylate cyclase [Lampropedia puyangensis]THU02856.1 diguanylate cyclase [Lampropedia puyangensis]
MKNGAEVRELSPASEMSLRRLIRRTQLKGALVIVLITSLCLIAAGMWTIGRYADMHLNLLARTLAYNVEAAMVFDDRVEVQQILDSIAEPEGLSQAQVQDTQGVVLGAYRDEGAVTAFANILSNRVIKQPVVVPVVHEGKMIGQVSVRIKAHTLLGFLAVGIGLVLAAVVLSAGVSTLVSKYLQRKLSQPLGVLSGAMRRIARERSFHERIPHTKIAELDRLGRDINSLIEEVERWHSSLEGEKALLAYHAEHDALTGAANRRQLEPLFQIAIKESERTGRSFALLALDCDDFKQVNDRYGHAAGDQVLKKLVYVIKRSIRQTDAIVRTGGDEFVILLAGVKGRDNTQLIARKIIQRISQTVLLGETQGQQLSISIGEALYPEDGLTLEQLMKVADVAMYSAKRHGQDSPALWPSKSQ